MAVAVALNAGSILLFAVIITGVVLNTIFLVREIRCRLFDGNPAYVGRLAFPSTTTGRQFFAKVSYLLRF